MENLEADNSLHINELPDIPLRRIFSFLPILDRLEAEKVCKRWRIIGKEGWPDVEKLEIDRDYSDDIILLILKRCGRFLKELTFHCIPELLNVLSMIIHLCELDQLKSIDIYVSYYLSARDVALVICQLRKILGKATKLVDIKYFGYLQSYGTDWINPANPRTLQQLSVRNYRTERLSINPDQFPNLKKLSLESIEIIGGEIRREKQSLKGLEVLEILRCHVPQDFFQRIGTFENLQELILRCNTCDIGNEHIRNIALHCCKLKKLDLTCSPNMTSECFKYLGILPSLEVLNLLAFHNVNSHDIVYLKNVNDLSFNCCTGDLTGDGVIRLIVESTNLEILRLRDIPLLNMTFLNNARQIFYRNDRKKPLALSVSAASWDNDDMLATIDHPLLTLNTYVPRAR